MWGIYHSLALPPILGDMLALKDRVSESEAPMWVDKEI